MPKAFFLTMDSAALKVAAEIPIWEMGKRTLKSEAISCPTAPTAVFPYPYVIRVPQNRECPA